MSIISLTLLYIFFGISIIYGGRHINPIIENIGLWISFFAIVHYRHQIAQLLKEIRSPRFAIYIGSSLPFMLVEENINCQLTGCSIIPKTIPILILSLAIVYYVTVRLKARHFWYILGIVCTTGLLLELSFGAAHGEFFALPIPWFIYVSFLVTMSCAYFTIVPLTYLLLMREQEKSL